VVALKEAAFKVPIYQKTKIKVGYLVQCYLHESD